MIDVFVRLLIEGAAVAATAWAANKLTKELTGKSIPAHLYAAWQPIREDIVTWIENNKDRKISRIIAKVNRAVDRVVSAAAKTIKVNVVAETNKGEAPVKEYRLLPQQATELFPELQYNDTALIVAV